jgi:nicotinamide-nucleotide amidase
MPQDRLNETRAPSVLAEIVSQGDEVVTGQTVDTNAAEIARTLTSLGLRVTRHAATGDDVESISALLREAASRADEVVCTGGLGPTDDDRTVEAVASAFGLRVEERPEVVSQIEAIFARVGRTMSERNRRQALVPAGAQLLRNHGGTAPGFCLQIPTGRGSCRLWFFPGVPREMRDMVQRYLVPAVRSSWPGVVAERLVTLRCIGTPEAMLNDCMAGVEGPGVRVGYRASAPEVQVKIRFARDVSPQEQEVVVRDACRRIGPSCFGVDSGPIEEVVSEMLLERKETVAAAESCTAGRLAAALTIRPGSSAYFLESAVVYANPAKLRSAGVRPETLTVHGAVSEEVARQMAEGIRVRAGATWGLSTTGIAGPAGGTPEKPVGTVHIAVAGPERTAHARLLLFGDREEVMTRAVASVLVLLRREMTAS